MKILPWRYSSKSNADTFERGSLPSFLIVGAQKSGTTFLSKHLNEHPNVLAPVKLDRFGNRKEISFFDQNFDNGLDWYRSYFPKLSKKLITGEATPEYLLHHHVPKRVSQILPDAKIIILLRNPADRAYSHYQHNIRLEREPASFEDAIVEETKRIKEDVKMHTVNEKYFGFRHRHYSYLTRGLYAEQIERWLKYFSREEILIIKFEELMAFPQKKYFEVLQFLGIPNWTPSKLDLFSSNPSNLRPEIIQYLKKYFEEPNKKLYELIKEDYEWK